MNNNKTSRAWWLAAGLWLAAWGACAQPQEPTPDLAVAPPTLSAPLPPALVVAQAQSAPAATPAGPAQGSEPAPLVRPTLVAQDTISAADTAWVMTSAALVLLMTLPGIALFYAGMVRRKSVINTMACTVAIAAVVSVLWLVAGYSWAFTPGTPWLGGSSRLGFEGVSYVQSARMLTVSHIAPHLPETVYAMFQLTFAVITAALVVGSFVERMKFSAMLWFAGLWSLLVYAPVAHWVWEPGGWLAGLGALDYAGGSVVHLNAGIAGLVCAFFLGPRRGYGSEPFEPFNLGLTMAGTGLLWVGWFGFNAGSALVADGRAGMAMIVTQMAAAAGALSWMGVEWIVRSRPSLLGLCSGAVAGLVAVTPASGFVTPTSGVLIGALAGIACYWGATALKRLLQADDSLDVFGVHGVGGLVGCLLTGVLASESISGAQGNVAVQALSAAAVMLYSALGTAVVLLLTRFLVGLRVDETAERAGLDLSQHRERIPA